MELEKISLKKDQEINSISLKPADNGGAVLSYTIYTPSLKNSESVWDEHTEVFSAEEIEPLALPRILELYKADFGKHVAGKASSSDAPIAAKSM